MLDKSAFLAAVTFIERYGRPLERWLCRDHFYNFGSDEVIRSLVEYQNVDGGFGHGLEPDFQLPYSSPLATSMALRHLSEIDEDKQAMQMIHSAMQYLERAFCKKRYGWYAVPKEVNDFTHTPWWHYNPEVGMTLIDRNWGNPSAELLSYMYKYRDIIKQIDVDDVIIYAITQLNNKDEFKSESEIYCYIRLYKTLPSQLAKRMEEKIQLAVQQLLSRDIEEWKSDYVPQPLHFANDPRFKFGISDELIDANLDYWVSALKEQGKLMPTWGKDNYGQEFEQVWNEWKGILTLDALVVLDSYHRIDRKDRSVLPAKRTDILID